MLIDAERDERVHTCLEKLDDKSRDAIRTAFFDGSTYAEIAENTGTPLGTIKSWVRRGLMKLKKCLEVGR